MTRLASCIFGSLLVFLPWAQAIGAETAGEDAPKVQEIRAVERGFFIEGQVGLTFFVNKLEDRTYGLSPIVGLFLGYDVLPVLNIAIGASAIAAGVSDDPEKGPQPRSDLFFAIPSLKVQFAVLTTERNFLWIAGEAGFALGLPAKIGDVDYGGNGPAFAGRVGFERFSKLRHFSLGIQAGVNVVTKPDVGIGISVLPTFKYTF
jgi:hypothetical protein